jgi:acyl carrier protein
MVTLTTEQLRNHLFDLLENELEIDRDIIKGDTDLMDELGIDSIDAVDLIIGMTELTGVRLKPHEFKQLRTIDDFVTALSEAIRDA